jgi:hypothetical protein
MLSLKRAIANLNSEIVLLTRPVRRGSALAGLIRGDLLQTDQRISVPKEHRFPHPETLA